MGRDSGDSARLLARLTSGGVSRTPPGWSDGDGVPVRAAPGPPEDHPDPFPAGTGTLRRGDPAGDGSTPGPRRRGRHADVEPSRRGQASRDTSRRATAWRLTGVPPGLAVLVLLVAVVGVLLLGRSGGSDEVLVGPTAEAGTTAAADVGTGEGAGEGAAAQDVGVVGDVVPGVPGTVSGPGSPGADAVPVPDPGADTAGGPGTDPAAGPAAAGAAVGRGSGPLLVHVDGAVQRPGVVELPPGARVGDAVLAAGGTTEEADTRLVNLARPLTDGELVVVPRPGEQPAAPAAPGPAAAGDAPGPGAGAAGAGPGSGTTAPGALVDLNSAGAAALDELPGIGPVLAERIVTWREESGPFVSVDDLTAVSGIGPAVLADIRDLVTV